VEVICCSLRYDLSIKSSSIRTNSIIVCGDDEYNLNGYGTEDYSYLSYKGVIRKTGKDTSGITANYIKI
jgi:hypothetical protein